MSQYSVAELTELASAISAQDVLSSSVFQLLVDIESNLDILPEPVYSNNNNNNNNNNNHYHQNNNNSHYSNRSRPPAEFTRSSTTVQLHATKPSNRKGGVSSSAAAAPSFKATKMDSKTGIEKVANNVRIALNKITATNFEKQRDAVVAMVNDYFAGSDSEVEVSLENTSRIAKVIFDIASTNKFFSDVYVLMYKDLIGVNDVFRTLIDDFVANFTSMEGFPAYVDSNVDYDGFCVYTKACEMKKSASTFLVNCLKQSLVHPSQITGILCKFLAFIHAHIVLPGFGKIVEELVENVFILTTLCVEELCAEELWDTTVLPSIRALVAERGNHCPSFSNRASFKCMDILDRVPQTK
jgi:hypothetical protein